MKKPVNFYSEGVRLVGDVYYPDDLKTGARHAGVVPRHTFGIVRAEYRSLPGSSRPGENTTKNCSPTRSPFDSTRGARSRRWCRNN